MLTDVQTPFLGTPVVPLKEVWKAMAWEADGTFKPLLLAYVALSALFAGLEL